MLKHCSSAKLKKIYERASPDSPHGHSKLLKGPETPIVDPATGILYVLTEEANLVSLTDFQTMKPSETQTGAAHNHISAKATLVADLGVGRPLGAAFAKDEHGSSIIYVADTLLGLIRVSNLPNNGEHEHEHEHEHGHENGNERSNHGNSITPRVEIIASSLRDSDGNPSRILYANDVDVGPITGHVYFTDSSTIPPERMQKSTTYTTRTCSTSTSTSTSMEQQQTDDNLQETETTDTVLTWDTMTAFKRDLLRGEKTGRLLRYKPETDQVDVLLDGLWFANGVAVDPDETFVMVIETSMARAIRYNLNTCSTLDTHQHQQQQDRCQNDPVSEVEVMVDALPGFPDGATCTRDRENKVCYAAIISPKPPIVALLNELPESISVLLRSLLLQLPSNLLRLIKPVRYGGVAVIRDNSSSGYGEMLDVELLQDPRGTEIGLVTGVTIFDGRLYMGSLTNDFVGLYDLE